MIDAPPLLIVQAVDRYTPGLWDAFFRAAWTGWQHYGRPAELTSWWRSLASNEAAGGMIDSQHLLALAFDLVPPDEGLRAAMESAGFIAIRYPRHIHCQALPAGYARRIGLLTAVGV